MVGGSNPSRGTTLFAPDQVFLPWSTLSESRFARFLPALLLQKGAWSLHAPVRWKEEDRVLDLDHTATLTSHYRDTGAWVPKEALWFAERFEALNKGAARFDFAQVAKRFIQQPRLRDGSHDQAPLL